MDGTRTFGSESTIVSGPRSQKGIQIRGTNEAERPRRRAREVAVGRRLPGWPLCPLASKAHQAGAPKKSSVRPCEALERPEKQAGAGADLPTSGCFPPAPSGAAAPPEALPPGAGMERERSPSACTAQGAEASPRPSTPTGWLLLSLSDAVSLAVLAWKGPPSVAGGL